MNTQYSGLKMVFLNTERQTVGRFIFKFGDTEICFQNMDSHFIFRFGDTEICF